MTRLGKFPSRRAALLLLAILLLLAAFGVWHGRQSSQPVKAAEPKPQSNRLVLGEDAAQLAFLKIDPAATAPLPASAPMNARLALADDVTARIFPALSGRVVNLQASIGDRVQRGAPLATLDAPDFGQAVADLRKAEADSAQKSKALARARILYEGEALARRELEAAEADARASQAESSRARLRLAGLSAADSHVEGQRLVLRAPLNGIVVDRQANPGTEVRQDTPNPLFVISDLRYLWLNIDLPETAAAFAKPGQIVTFSVPAYPGTDFRARVEKVGAMVDPTTRRIQVRATVDNADGRLKPEMYAHATISTPDAPALIRLPAGAVLTGGIRSYVFVEAAPRTFERRAVNIARNDTDLVYLTPDSPVKPGDKVVVRGALLLSSEMAQGE